MIDNALKNRYNRHIEERGRGIMIAKVWKKVCLVILIVACLFNIVNKLVRKLPLNAELQTSATYLEKEQTVQEK